MGLVDYASDDSDVDEVPSTSTPATKPAPSSKPAFQKVVDRSAPNKIRVNISSTVNSTAPSTDGAEPPAKRPRLGGGGGGFNSFLPAAKKAPTVNAGKTGNARVGLGRGVSLKTGSEAAFSREPMPPSQPVAAPEEVPRNGDEQPSTRNTVPISTNGTTSETEPMKPKGKTTMFRPLSVARKPAKKKITNPAAVSSTEFEKKPGAGQAPITEEPAIKTKPKGSFFSMNAEPTPTASAQGPPVEYQPLFYGTNSTTEIADGSESQGQAQAQSTSTLPLQPAESGSLGAIADDLHLTASQRRQLFGRGGKDPSFAANALAKNVVNFNTDAEYAANEVARLAGETPEQQHKAVRTVNTSGKNSLRQLVNVVATQGEALEEHFAKGRRNKSEAGSRYGW